MASPQTEAQRGEFSRNHTDFTHRRANGYCDAISSLGGDYIESTTRLCQVVQFTEQHSQPPVRGGGHVVMEYQL